MSAVQQISAKQVADLVTSLARGRTVAQTATRMHMAESVVKQIGELNGYPNPTELNRNSRILNKRLRETLPEEDLDTDVPVVTDVPVAGSAPSDEVPEPEVDEPVDEDVVLWRCVRRGCGYELRGPKSAAEDDVQRAIELHKQTHRNEGTVEIQDGVHHVGHRPGERRPHDCAACRAEAVEPPVIVPGEVIDETTTPDAVIAAIDATLQIAEDMVEAVGSGEVLEENTSGVGSYECPVDGCDFQVLWAGQSEDPEDDRVVDDYIDQQIADHEMSHRVQVAHVPDGSTVPEALGAILATMGGQLAATQDSPDPLPSGEAVPDAADTSEQHGEPGSVEEPPNVADGRSDTAPRTIEWLLDEAMATNHTPIVDLAVRLRRELQHLADRLDRWVDRVDQRKAILHELDILGRRQDELTEKLARLDADTDADTAPLVVASQTPTLLAQAQNDIAAAILEDKANEPRARTGQDMRALVKESLWGQLPTDVRTQIRPWCQANGVEVSRTARVGQKAIEAYLAAHPEDDPRLNTPEENR